MAVKKMVVVVTVSLLLLGRPGLAEPPKVEGESGIDAYAKLTKGTEKAYFEMTLGGTRSSGENVNGNALLWLDTKQGLYKELLTIHVIADGQAHNLLIGVLFTPGGETMWTLEEGVLRDLQQDKEGKTVPGRCMWMEHMGALNLFTDAAFGYEKMRAETDLKPVKSPLDPNDTLRWFELVGKPGTAKVGVLDTMTGRTGGRISVGLSLTTGWPAKFLLKNRDEDSSLTVTKVDLNPDLKGVFELPADVKARLPKEEEK